MELGMKTVVAACFAGLVLLVETGCQYGRLLRPSVLKQLNPRVVALVNELPEVDHPNEAIVARLFVHGGLSHATRGADGVYRDRIYVPADQYIFYPSIIAMDAGGELELEVSNDDVVTHAVFMPDNRAREVVMLPVQQAGRLRVRLDQPGLYWFGCPISNHAGRGMLGLVIVKGDVPAQARLDRPPQKRP
jgi:PQQ system protein